MACLLCGEKTTPFKIAGSTILYHTCSHCMLRYKDPSCYQTLEAQKSRYDLHTNDAEDEGYRAYFQRFLDFVLPHIKSVERALDFGCGRSRLLADMLGEAGILCDAYDPIYHPDTSYRNKMYDLVVSTEVFEHLHRPKESFEALVGVLKEGGYLAIQTQFYPTDLQAFATWYYHKDPTHILFYRPETFERLAALYGCNYLADNGKNMVILRKEESRG